MEKITAILFGILLMASGNAQAPQKMTYQAVVRNSTNALVQNSIVGMKVSILQGSVTGTAVYVETQIAQTNQNGLLTIEIGGGTVVVGTYHNGIFWGGGPYFIKTEIDPLGGTSYTITATSEFLSVPYSNFAHIAGSMVGNAWNFIGVYIPTGAAMGDIKCLVVSYLGPDKVLFTMYGNSNFGVMIEMSGNIVGNTVTIPDVIVDFFSGFTTSGPATKTGNNLTLSLVNAVDPIPLLSFIKQ